MTNTLVLNLDWPRRFASRRSRRAYVQDIRCDSVGVWLPRFRSGSYCGQLVSGLPRKQWILEGRFDSSPSRWSESGNVFKNRQAFYRTKRTPMSRVSWGMIAVACGSLRVAGCCLPVDQPNRTLGRVGPWAARIDELIQKSVIDVRFSNCLCEAGQVVDRLSIMRWPYKEIAQLRDKLAQEKAVFARRNPQVEGGL